VQSIPYVDDEATLHALPSGREFIGVSGHGQWHHYGIKRSGRP
jgi:hypothetical protein